MAKGPLEKRTMNKNSLANLTPGRANKPGVGQKLNNSFKKDVLALWTKKNKDGTTKGQELLEKMAKDNPSAFLKLIATIIPKDEVLPKDKSNEPSASDFAKTLMDLNRTMGNARAKMEDDAVVDIKPFESKKDLPVDLEEDN